MLRQTTNNTTRISNATLIPARRSATLELTAAQRSAGVIAYRRAAPRVAVSYQTPDGCVCVTDTPDGVPALLERLSRCGYRLLSVVRL